MKIAIAALGFMVLLLAAIYVPEYKAGIPIGQLQTERENFSRLIRAEQDYFSKHGTYIAAAPRPASINAGECTSWMSASVQHDAFDELGWAPGNCSRCRYAVAADGEAFTAAMECDIKHPGHPGALAYVAAKPGSWTGLKDPFGRCSADGIYAGSKHLINTVGPCQDFEDADLGMFVAAGREVVLDIKSIPAGAAVSVNGQRVGKTPLYLHNPPRGNLAIEVAKSGFKTRSFPLKLTDDAYSIQIPLLKD